MAAEALGVAASSVAIVSATKPATRRAGMASSVANPGRRPSRARGRFIAVVRV